MHGCRLLAAAALVAIAVATPSLFAQQQPRPAPAAATESPEQIKRELDRIKKGRTLAIMPAAGFDDGDGATALRLDNASPFSLIVLLVGPTTQRIELGPERMQSLAIEPGDYEIAVTVVGRDIPPFYGKQKVVANMHFRHQFVIPGV